MQEHAPAAASAPLRTVAAWGVHLLTAGGAVVALFALIAIDAGKLSTAGLWILLALCIDAVDGTLARRVRVTEFAPLIDGRRLDDIVDFLNYVIVPVFFMQAAGVLPGWPIAAAAILASAYGFSQHDAKTDDDFFLGFPSYWNVVALYLWRFDLGPVAGGAIVLACAVLVFVPLKYVYPSKLHTLGWTTVVSGAAWVVILAVAVAAPAWAEGLPLLEISLAYPIFYLGLSFALGGLHRRG